MTLVITSKGMWPNLITFKLSTTQNGQFLPENANSPSCAAPSTIEQVFVANDLMVMKKQSIVIHDQWGLYTVDGKSIKNMCESSTDIDSVSNKLMTTKIPKAFQPSWIQH